MYHALSDLQVSKARSVVNRTKSANQVNDIVYRDTLPAGYQLLWYELQSVLGRGGYGITYLALDKNLDRQVAIKEYLPTEFASRISD